jgi:glycosyltransferase involved in cell wall biosynthesis
MSYRPFVSVVIPTFNRARQVQAALKSVLTQTYPEFEVIVIDDGSTDGTRETLQQIVSPQGSNGKQVRYCFQPNQGQSAARNNGIDEARGEWVAFLDSDDVWLPDKLEWQLRAIEQFGDKCCACVTDARLVDDLGADTTAFHVSGKQYRQTLGIEAEATKNLAKSFDHFWTSTLMARTDLIRQVGQFDPHLEFAEDHDLLFRLSLATSYCYVSKPLSIIDRSCSPPGSTSRPWDQVEVRLRCRQSMLEKWLTSNSNLAGNVRKIIVGNLRQTHSAWTNWYLEHERYEEARQAVSKAVKYEFTATLAIKWILTHVAPTLARSMAPKVRFY